MPVKMMEEGKMYPSTTATDEEKQEVMDGALGLINRAKDEDMNFFLGVFEKDKDGTPGVVLTGRGSPNDMMLLAESLADKAQRTARPPSDFITMLQDIFGADTVHVIEDGSEFEEGTALDMAMKSLIEHDHPELKKLDEEIENSIPRGEEEVDQEPMGDGFVNHMKRDPAKKHPDEDDDA